MSTSSFSRGSRIVILCEGDTEEVAIRNFIVRQWHSDNLKAIGLHAVNLNGKLQDGIVKAPLYLDEEDVRAVFTLVDLYGMSKVVHNQNDSLDAKVMRVRDWFRERVKHPRVTDFFPHVCVHETEAWLLAEGLALAKRLGDSKIVPDPQAEEKNFQSPPQKRVDELFFSRKKDHYRKIRDGGPLFGALQFEPIYKTCKR